MNWRPTPPQYSRRYLVRLQNRYEREPVISTAILHRGLTWLHSVGVPRRSAPSRVTGRSLVAAGTGIGRLWVVRVVVSAGAVPSSFSPRSALPAVCRFDAGAARPTASATAAACAAGVPGGGEIERAAEQCIVADDEADAQSRIQPRRDGVVGINE